MSWRAWAVVFSGCPKCPVFFVSLFLARPGVAAGPQAARERRERESQREIHVKALLEPDPLLKSIWAVECY